MTSKIFSVIGAVLFVGLGLLAATLSQHSAPLACWLWQGSELPRAKDCHEWLLYQGDVIDLRGGSHFVVRGVQPAPLSHPGPVTLLVRVYELPEADWLADHILHLRAQWRRRGVTVKQVQIDHDAAASQLGRYADFLAALRLTLPSSLGLSITGLASWAGDNPADTVLLAESADYIAFQLYQRYQPLERAEALARRLARLPFSYKLGVTRAPAFAGLEFKKGSGYLGKILFLHTGERP